VKTGLPDQGRFAATAFTVGDTAYVFGGKQDDLTLTNELWRYIPATDTWTQMTSMPAAARMYAMAWSGTSHGIIAGGESSNITLPEAMFYRPSTDTWGYVPGYPGAGGWAGCAFTVNDTAYAGLGINGIVPHRDLWALESANLTAVPEAAAGIGALSLIPDVCAPSSVVRINASEDLLRSITRIELYDLTGRRVLDVPGRSNSSQFHVPQVTDGRYVMSVSLADGTRRGLPLTIVE
jgi:hypothetical protein